MLEETGLNVTESRYLFSIPNIYNYSGMELHTMDIFFLCKVEDCTTLAADDDVARLEWISIDRLESGRFGLQSIKKSIEKFKKIYKEL